MGGTSVHVTLNDEVGAILEWLGAREKKVARNDDSPGPLRQGLLYNLVAGTGFEPVTFRL